jgi:uncharacterized protein YkwD
VLRIGLCLGSLLVLGAVALHGSPAGAVGEPVNGFPNWAERVIHEWANRARVDPQVEMNACGAPCLEHACYAAAMPPLTWNEALNRAARYHSDEMVRQGYFAHNSACTVVSNISTLYPATCNGAASCACVGGTKSCSPTCTDFGARVERFGGSPSGEIIVSTSDPDQSFYIWLFEPGDTTSCQFTSANGHRWLILKSTGAIGVGVAGYSTGDFGSGSAPTKIPSGAHYPQQAASVQTWANWYDSAGPSLATVNVDGTCTAMTLRRGTPTNGAWSATVTGVGTGCHRYYFNFRDASGTSVSYPTTGSLAIGSGAGCPDWDSSRPPACAIGTTSPGPANTPTSTPTQTPRPSSTLTRTATVTATPSHSRTPSPAATPIPSATPSSTAPPSGLQVSGYVRYYSNDLPVPQIGLHASDAAMTASSASTDSSGHYVLADVGVQNLLVSADAVGGTGNAISALDAAYVLQYVAGLRSLSAEQSLACDVTGNGTLSGLDATLLLQYATGLISTFPVRTACNSDWVFIPNPAPAPSQTLVQPQPGASECVPGGIAYATLAASLDEQNFSALVFGDCTGNWQPPQRASALRAVRGTVGETATARARWLPSGRLALRVAVDAAEPIYAAQMEIAYDPVALRMVRARLVGGARHAALAANNSEAGIVRLALANAEAIRADGRPLAVILFESLSAQRAAVPSVSIRVNRD